MTIAANHTWLMPDDIVDKHCTPIIMSILKVENDIVTYKSNYSESEKTMSVPKFTTQFVRNK